MSQKSRLASWIWVEKDFYSAYLLHPPYLTLFYVILMCSGYVYV